MPVRKIFRETIGSYHVDAEFGKKDGVWLRGPAGLQHLFPQGNVQSVISLLTQALYFAENGEEEPRPIDWAAALEQGAKLAPQGAKPAGAKEPEPAPAMDTFSTSESQPLAARGGWHGFVHVDEAEISADSGWRPKDLVQASADEEAAWPPIVLTSGEVRMIRLSIENALDWLGGIPVRSDSDTAKARKAIAKAQALLARAGRRV